MSVVSKDKTKNPFLEEYCRVNDIPESKMKEYAAKTPDNECAIILALSETCKDKVSGSSKLYHSKALLKSRGVSYVNVNSLSDNEIRLSVANPYYLFQVEMISFAKAKEIQVSNNIKVDPLAYHYAYVVSMLRDPERDVFGVKVDEIQASTPEERKSCSNLHQLNPCYVKRIDFSRIYVEKGCPAPSTYMEVGEVCIKYKVGIAKAKQMIREYVGISNCLLKVEDKFFLKNDYRQEFVVSIVNLLTKKKRNEEEREEEKRTRKRVKEGSFA